MAEISAALGIAITAFQGCVQALVLISQARGTPQDLEDAQLRTELLLNSLVTWAKAVGLTDDPPTLQMSLRDAQYVPRILKRLESLFSDLNELKRKYKLVIKSTGEEFESIDDGPAWMQYVNLSGYLKRTQPWKRLKWISIDKDKFKDLLDSAKEYIGELRAFLKDAPLEREQNFFELILRIDIINTRDEGKLGIMQQELQVPGKPAISTVARLKQTNVALGLSPATSLANQSVGTDLAEENSIQPRDMKITKRLLLLDKNARSKPVRTLAQYDSRVVLLEWKYVRRIDSSSVSKQVLKRVNQVAAFLQNMGPALHSLQCRGFVEDKTEDRYGYVFDLPAELDPSSPATQLSGSDPTAANSQPLCLKTLRQMLGQFKLPSLNFRLRMAVILLENLLNLHTSGWLHKEFRSENILLIGPSDGFKDMVVTDPSMLSVYIAGYITSRMDHPSEMTEPLEPELEADLYRHPALLSNTTKSYQKSFDVFSVGCILLEIGLWSPLRQILEDHSATHSNQSRPKMPESRSFSLPHPMHKSSLGKSSDDRDLSNQAVEKKKDFSALKHTLLCSQRPDPDGQDGNALSKMADASFNPVMSSLQSHMGKRYTRVVEQLLAAKDLSDHASTAKPESALDFEMRVRNEIQSIAKAI